MTQQNDITLDQINELRELITTQPSDYIQLTYRQHRNLINLIEGTQQKMVESIQQWLTAND